MYSSVIVRLIVMVHKNVDSVYFCNEIAYFLSEEPSGTREDLKKFHKQNGLK